MKFNVRQISFTSVLVALACLSSGYFLQPGFWQSVAIGLGTTFLGLGLAVLAVNHALTSSDKKLAAKPVYKLIMPNTTLLHNDLLIRHMHKELGKDQFEELFAIYEKHKGNPSCFSPQQRDVIFDAINKIKPELTKIYETLQEQLRELTLLLGWSFDSQITDASLSARVSMATFLAATWDGTDKSKREIIEAYIDSDATLSAVVIALSKHLDIKDEEWLREA